MHIITSATFIFQLHKYTSLQTTNEMTEQNDTYCKKNELFKVNWVKVLNKCVVWFIIYLFTSERIQQDTFHQQVLK